VVLSQDSKDNWCRTGRQVVEYAEGQRAEYGRQENRRDNGREEGRDEDK
jgi:hypothetical protein